MNWYIELDIKLDLVLAKLGSTDRWAQQAYCEVAMTYEPRLVRLLNTRQAESQPQLSECGVSA